MVALNSVYMKYVTKAQSLLTSTKIFALLIIVIGGIVLLAQGKSCFNKSERTLLLRIRYFNCLYGKTTALSSTFAPVD